MNVHVHVCFFWEGGREKEEAEKGEGGTEGDRRDRAPLPISSDQSISSLKGTHFHGVLKKGFEEERQGHVLLLRNMGNQRYLKAKELHTPACLLLSGCQSFFPCGCSVRFPKHKKEY